MLCYVMLCYVTNYTKESKVTEPVRKYIKNL